MRGAHPAGPIGYWVTLVEDFVFVVVDAIGGYVVVVLELSFATPLVLR